MPLYHVKDWDACFVNAKSLEVKNPTWAPVPTKQDGLGYSRLMRHENGAALYGAFVALVLRLSKSPKATRLGYVTDTGGPNGVPLLPVDVSETTKMPEAVVAEMFAVLSTPEIGWLEVAEKPVDGGEKPENYGRVPASDATGMPTGTEPGRLGVPNADASRTPGRPSTEYPEEKIEKEPTRTRAGAREDSVRFFGCEGLGKIFQKCGWKSALDIDKAVNTVHRKGKPVSVEWFMACLVEKFEAGLKSPAGAAISAFTDAEKLWTPTDKAIRRFRDLAFPPEPRSAQPRAGPTFDPDFDLACKMFRAKGAAYWRKFGIGSAKELQLHAEFQKLKSQGGAA